MNRLSFVALGILFIFALFVSCREDIPKWNGKLYVSDPDIPGVKYRVDDEVKEIDCRSDDFNDFICMSMADFQSFYETYILKCKGWETKEKMSIDDINQYETLLNGSTNP